MSYLLTTFLICDPKQEPDGKRYDYGVIRFVWRMAIHPSFQAIFLLGTIINLYVLSKVHFTGDKAEMEKTIEFQLKCLIALNLLYFIEIVVKLTAFDVKAYIASRMNILDFLLCLLFSGSFITD